MGRGRERRRRNQIDEGKRRGRVFSGFVFTLPCRLCLSPPFSLSLALSPSFSSPFLSDCNPRVDRRRSSLAPSLPRSLARKKAKQARQESTKTKERNTSSRSIDRRRRKKTDAPQGRLLHELHPFDGRAEDGDLAPAAAARRQEGRVRHGEF